MRRAGLLVLATLVLAVPAAAAQGDLDRTFSGDGWVRTYDIFGYSKGFFPKGAEDVAIQPLRTEPRSTDEIRASVRS